MGNGLRRPSPALVISFIALFVALGGSVYAAAKIDGHTIKAKSLPGNRLAIGSVPSNRLKPGSIPGSRLAPGSITGIQVDSASLDTVPTAIHASTADTARDATSALSAVNSQNAEKINGYGAGCKGDTRLFAGACWDNGSSEGTSTAPAAAAACASRGGELPAALALAWFAKQPETNVAEGGEWTSDITNFSGPDVYAVITANSVGQINSAASTASKHFRCVFPLVG